MFLKVWPFLFSHYSFESKSDERIEIDQSVTDRYQTLIKEWQNAEGIITKLDIQRSNRRKNSTTRLQSNPNSNESTVSSLKNVLAKISIPTSETLERKDSNMSNEVFYEVYLMKKKHLCITFCLSGIANTYGSYFHPKPNR